jgi:hypothetical protein
MLPQICEALGSNMSYVAADLQSSWIQHVICCCRFAKFLAVLTLESFTSTALGLAVGAGAPNADTAAAIGPAIMVIFIVFGGTTSSS